MSEPQSARRIPQLPALDGLRGLAAAGVVAFHAQLGWMRGGFLAVSTFFTLSGFLLGALVLAEQRDTGTIDVRAFWGRRFRRLLPAALLAVAGVAAAAPWLATAEQLATLRGDALAALTYMANWRFIVEGRAYADLFADPSPVQHFWSLSIEEQFFVVLPGLLLLTRGRTRVTVAAVASITVASAAALWLVHDPADGGMVAYYATFTRASEFGVGVLLAALLGRPTPAADVRVRRALGLAGPVALAALVALWSTTTDGSPWLYHGGFPLVALLTAAVIVSLVQGGPLSRVLGSAPLRELGRRSYGVYLYHWPVLLWMTPRRVGVDGTALLALQLSLVAALAAASYAWVEQPVRSRRRLPGRAALVAAPCAMALVAGGVLVATADPPTPELVFERQADPTIDATDDTGASGEPGSEAPRVLIVGDSMANNLAGGLARADRDVTLWDRTTPGCGLAESERRVEADAGWKAPDPGCDPGWRARWSAAVEEIRPDVVVVQVGTQEVWDRRVDGVEIPFDAEAGQALSAAELDQAIEVLTADGATVVLVTLPASNWETWGLHLADPQRSVNNPAWVADWNERLRAAAQRHPDRCVVADLAGLLTPSGGYQATVDDVVVRAGDGLHLTASGQDLAASWLIPIVEQAAG